jgi:hypothetical protein
MSDMQTVVRADSSVQAYSKVQGQHQQTQTTAVSAKNAGVEAKPHEHQRCAIRAKS